MAELTTEHPPTSSCCSAETQAPCCEPSEQDGCCGSGAPAASCGCSAGAEAQDLRETVRARYAAAARQAADAEDWTYAKFDPADTGEQRFGGALYGEEGADAPAASVNASLGCGVPTAVADLCEGETVLDLGSGAGADVLISARRVGPSGKAIGLDMTDEMLALARANAAQAGVENVEFVRGYIEEVPLPNGSVDVIVSNCVLNLSGDKPKVFAEAFRVLKPGGRFAVSDVIADPGMDDATRADMAQWTGCIAGALTEDEFRDGLAAAGFTDIEIRETHRVHEFARSAIIRARTPEHPASSATPTTGTESAAAMSTLTITHVTPEAPASAHRIELFEPAMCCQSGVCGPSVDQQLIDIREDLRWAQHQGAKVTRHNLSSDPDAFVANPKVTGLMSAFGEKSLPALLVDGDIVMHGRYPTRAELAGFLAAKPDPVAELPVSSDGCGCGSSGCC